MIWVTVGSAALLECGACDGTWVEAHTFEHICADRKSQAALLHPSERAVKGAAGLVAARAFRYRPCLVCRKLMNRVNFGRSSGAVVDVCKGHGTFLDRGELHQIVRFIQGGGIDRLRTAEREQLAEERRRLRDAERMHARTFPDSSTSTLNDTSLRALLSALLGW